jgi:hypothetical protein
MKKILCVNYSQSGQLDEILDNFLSPLEGCEIDRIKVEPNKDFPFPWKTNSFYDAMPETVLEEPIELEPFSFKEEHYDLIIFGYQPWFLSPSMPATALLKNREFKKRLNNTPVITVIGARNMWLNSQKSVVKHVQDAGGKIVGNIPLVDRAQNLLSAVSIVHWMMTGTKTRKWGIFPLPGVSQEDIEGCSRYGGLLNDRLKNNELSTYQDAVLANDGLRINTSILFIEERAKKIFYIWANIIKKKEAKGKNRAFWISFFRFYLNFALFGVAPIILTIYTVLIRPLTLNSLKRKKEHLSYLGIDRSK